MNSTRLEQGNYLGEDQRVIAGTITCSHCQRIVSYSTRQELDERADICLTCMALCCLPCKEQGGCTPWEKKMEQMEHRDRMLRAMEAAG